MLNLLNNTKLFCDGDPSESPCVWVNDEVVDRYAGAAIRYSGKRLYKVDQDVLIALIRLSAKGIGEFHSVSVEHILRQLDLPMNEKNSQWLCSSLRRLGSATIFIDNPMEGFHLFAGLHLNQAQGVVGFCIVPRFLDFFQLQP